jgi:hypothetical protein
MKKLSVFALALASCGAPSEWERIGRNYESYGQVDDAFRWGTPLCVMPPPPELKVSAAPPTSPHGRKLYHLYAKHRDAYVKGGEQPLGQVLVKEAWEAVDGKPGPKQGLYVMMKTGDVDSDAGWMYGTLTPDGRVTSSGRVASCMDCHRDAMDRIFGLKR